MDILRILNNDLTGLTEEEKIYAVEFRENLRDKLIEDLVKFEAESLIEKLSRSKESFVDSIDNIFTNGVKGYNTLTMQLLISIYLDKIGEKSFFDAIESING